MEMHRKAAVLRTRFTDSVIRIPCLPVIEPTHPRGATLLRHIREIVSNDDSMNKERSRLVKLCCEKTPEHLLDAPRPVTISI
jgi:hypothetical protein